MHKINSLFVNSIEIDVESILVSLLLVSILEKHEIIGLKQFKMEKRRNDYLRPDYLQFDGVTDADGRFMNRL